MNFNEQQNRYPARGGRRLIKRPMETPGLEANPNPQQAYSATMSHPQYPQMYPNNTFQVPQQQFTPGYPQGGNQNSYGMPAQPPGFSTPVQSGILSDPLVANMAMQYGQALGRQIVNKEIGKYVPISKVKYYFAVDTSYVSRKLSIILFPYLHSDWSIRYDQNEPIQPKFEVNAPDLYIPTMAFLTYVLTAGLILGTKNQFSPEKLGIEATSAMAWTVFEVIVQLLTLYIANISTNLKTLDLIAYSSYKYVGIIIAMLIHLLLGHVGYLSFLVYISASIAFFLIRTLKLQVLSEPASTEPDMYGAPPQSFHQVGLKRRQYFLLFVACTQPVLIWWLTYRIV